MLQAGVIGLPDPVYNELVAAYVSLRSRQRLSEQELKDFARARLADYKVPERIGFLAELPKGPTGKVHRRALEERALTELLGRTDADRNGANACHTGGCRNAVVERESVEAQIR